MRGRLVSIIRQLEADRLSYPERQHSKTGRHKEEPPAQALCEEGRCHRDSQVPDLQNPVDEQLRGRVRDTDGVEDLVKVI